MRPLLLAPLLLAVGVSAAPAKPKPASALPFIEDDLGKALKEAKARKLPIFVEAWAPW